MLTLFRPNDAVLASSRRRRHDDPLTYPQVHSTHAWPWPMFQNARPGRTVHTIPAGYTLGGHAGVIGRGDNDFQSAIEAIRSWQMFPLSWASLESKPVCVEPGNHVALGLRGPGFWVVADCRILYRVDETNAQGSVDRAFGFAYGTLSSHPMRGEERFLVGMDARTGDVWYEIASYCRPRAWYARIGWPAILEMQRRFRIASLHAMRETRRNDFQ